MPVLAQTVHLNEVLANGVTALGGSFDGVEIYNSGGMPADLSDYSLSDSVLSTRKYVFPAATVVPAGGFLTVVLDPANTNNNFGLKSSGDTVYLYTPGGLPIDQITFGLQVADLSLGRVPDGSGPWTLTSPTFGSANAAVALSAPEGVKFNEWMANPSSGDDYFELFNSNTNPVALGGLILKDSGLVVTVIAAHSFIGVGVNGFIAFIADDDTAAGADHVAFKLGAGGDSLYLSNALGTTLFDTVTFGLQGQGLSEGRLPDGGPPPFRTFPNHATPGEPNFGLITSIQISELLAHTDPPLEDAIELYNATDINKDLGGWYVSDKFEDLTRYRIPNGTMVPARGYAVIYEYQFNGAGGVNPTHPFTFNSAHGGSLFLTEPDSGGTLINYLEQDFPASENGVSFGRLVASDGKAHFTAMARRSFGRDGALPSGIAGLAVFRQGTGLTNSPGPKIGPVIINELMFQPPDIIEGGVTNDNSLDEFIELRNVTTSLVRLYDPNALTNHWKLANGVSYEFSTNDTIPALGYILVVNFDPVTNTIQTVAFRAKYGVAESVPLYGPYSGKLDNNGEPIELFKPDPPQGVGHPDEGFVPFILVDKVRYNDAAPWPTNAAGTGKSLQRNVIPGFGNDPTNWTAALPNAGRLNAQILNIITQPQSQSVLTKSNAVFTVEVEGDLPAYQWYKRRDKIPGARGRGPSLIITNASRLRHASTYSVRVTNIAGSVKSSNATLSVITPVKISLQPRNKTVVQGRSVTNTARATGTKPFAWQWWQNGSPILDATNSRLIITNFQPVISEGVYTATVSNLLSGAVSFPATLTLKTNSP